jgi:hypothetical protein
VVWEREASLPERVETAWKRSGPKRNLGEVSAGLGRVTTDLQIWSKEKFENVTKQLK